MDTYKYEHTDQLKEIDLPKLIRDKIPTINKKRFGTDLNCRIANSDEEYLYFLLKKLCEEAEELKNTNPSELSKEIADIYEIIDAIIKLQKIDKKQIKTYQKTKRKDNGGFKKRILLLSK